MLISIQFELTQFVGFKKDKKNRIRELENFKLEFYQKSFT